VTRDPEEENSFYKPRWIVIAILGATLVVAWPLFLPWVYDTHDGHYAFYNAAQFDLALRDGQLPVRWLPDLFGGRGLPHFVYYHPLVFYLTSALNLTGMGFIASVKTLYVLSLALSGFAMYRWLRSVVVAGAAAVGAVAYVLAPFRVLEIHVKGDPPAALAFVFVPLVLIAIRRAARGDRGGVLALALASAGLVLSHSVTAFLLLAPLLLYAAFELDRHAFSGGLRLLAGGSIGAMLSAFFWLPAMAEKSLVHVDSPLGILFFDFREHFVEPWQWLSPLWGYHGSFAGTPDDMSFQIGPIHAVGLIAGILAWRTLKPGAARRATGWALIVVAGALLGTLALSRPVWELVGPLRFVQYPWRLLSVVAVGSSVTLAAALAALPGRRLLAVGAAAPPVVTLAFALATCNRWYGMTAAAYAVAGILVWLVYRVRGRPRSLEAPLMCVLMAAAALPWTAVPLHAAFKGEPALVEISEADLAPERVRLGVRRTTARDDYLPRSVERIPPRDPDQEYLPPVGALPPSDIVAEGIRVLEIRRSSGRFDLTYSAATPARATLNLHDFPGWRAWIVGDAPGELDHEHDDEGRIVLSLPEGRHRVQLRFERTAPRIWGEGLSLVAMAAVLVWGLVLWVRTRRPAPR
jgi:hypothetical protein